jgi:hypothetical protein
MRRAIAVVAVVGLLAGLAVTQTPDQSTEGATGACCLPGNACLPQSTAEFCIVIVKGVYQGDGTTCGGDCGMCCIDKIECHSSWSPDHCAYTGGQFFGNIPCGPDSPCGPSVCDSDIDGDGEVGILDFLDLLANWTDPYDIVDYWTLLADWGPCPP